MEFVLNSNDFELQWGKTGSGFNLIPKGAGEIKLENCEVKASYFIKGRRCEDTLTNLESEQVTLESKGGRPGRTACLNVTGNSQREGIHYQLSFALARDAPVLMWKIALFNQSNLMIEMDRFDMLRIGTARENGDISIPPESMEALAFFSNGWQSWSRTGVYTANEKQRRTRLGPFSEPMDCNAGTPISKTAGHFSSDFFGVVGDRKTKWGLLAGFLSQKEQFGSVEARIGRDVQLNLWANGDRAQILPGKSMWTDWAVLAQIDLSAADPLADYFDRVGAENEARIPKQIYTGWCSWYEYYTLITPEIILRNLDLIAEKRDSLAVDVFQIDDGFEAQAGDWFKFKPEFPQGVAGLAEQIKAKNLIPGLWLAPFILHPGADICKEHPDWVLKDSRGRAVNAGFVWNSFTRALDISRPEALDYICEVVRTAVKAWGFPYLKLDFLYAGALPGRHADATRTRAQIFRKAMERIREAIGDDVFLLGCGAPLGPVLGLVDAMRISCDVAGEWSPRFKGVSFFFKDEPFMPSARNAIHNIITRNPLHRRWWVNDPDCLLVRPNSKLTLDEVKTLAAAIGMSGGMMLLSDNMETVNTERLRIAQALLPPVGTRPRVLDWFDPETPRKLRQDFSGPTGVWHILAWFNWADRPVEVRLDFSDFDLEDNDCMVRSFWDDHLRYSAAGKPLWQETVAAHASLLLAVRKMDVNQAIYLGGDMHFSQGMEVSAWEPLADGVKLALNTQIEGKIELYLPFEVKNVEIEGFGPVDWELNDEKILCLKILPGYSGKSIRVTTRVKR